MNQPEKPLLSAAEELKMEEARLIDALSRVRARKKALSPAYEPYYQELQDWYVNLLQARPELTAVRFPHELRGTNPIDWRACSWKDNQAEFFLEVTWELENERLEAVCVLLMAKFVLGDADMGHVATFPIRAREPDLETATAAAFRELYERAFDAKAQWERQVYSLKLTYDALPEHGKS